MDRGAASQDLLGAICKGLPSALRTVAADLLPRAPSRPTAKGASLLVIGIAVQVFVLLAASDPARADCASGDGNITIPGTCTTPQNLTGPIGIVVSGAALTTNPTAYTISSSGGTLVNNGSITSNGSITVVGNVPSNITNTGDIEGGLVERATSSIHVI